MIRTLAILALVFLTVPKDGQAQDVEMLGRRYGTRVPDGYARGARSDPTVFRFRRGWGVRGVRRDRGGGPAFLDRAAARNGPALLGPRADPVLGTFRIPVVLGLYENSDPVPPFSRDAITAAYFGSGSGTVTDYYDEVSGGRVIIEGGVLDWVRAPRPDDAYTADESGIPLPAPGLGGAGAWNFVYELLGRLPATVQWELYDNDGPDGIANSGDDDGYVDVLGVFHPTMGGECGGVSGPDRIWAHHWSLSIPLGTPFVTARPAAGGGFIRIDDYLIQGTIACPETGMPPDRLNEIGVMTHEVGHAFGLPDLYDTTTGDGQHSGAGIWDLMSSGAWGCDNDSPESPCHMGAWSKAALGWADVVTLAPDTDHGTLMLPPVETSGTVYRVDATDGSGEYFLIENRQRLGYDQSLLSEGLLVWQIDEDWVQGRWAFNQVNAQSHMGVWLRQADGRDDLGRGAGRGDAGDPFPGQSANAAFHAATVPTPTSFGGSFTGLTMFGIAPAGDDMQFRLLTRETVVTARAIGTTGTTGLFTVDGQAMGSPVVTFTTPPFLPHTIEAASGDEIGPGERAPFTSWQDDPAAARSRVIATPVTDTEYVATYSGSEYALTLTATGGVNGVAPARFSASPASSDLWFAPGTNVSVTAEPRTGFTFLGWTGALAGQGNPAAVVMATPIEAGADFDLVYAVSDTVVELPAATALNIQLDVQNGTAPVNWTLVDGALPVGVDFTSSGLITGASVEMGTFPVTVSAIDGIGLPATAVITLDFVRPSFPIDQLTYGFLLTGTPLTEAQREFLDREGNGAAGYDVGDFRAWALSDPTVPLSLDLVNGVYQGTIVLRPVTGSEEGRR